jgi:hypothetical protein
MNANDLADRLEQFYTGAHIQKAAETLRQQQAEIEAAEQHILDAFERGKMFGYSQGLRKTQDK